MNNPLRLDPTRSVSLRRALDAEIGRWFLDVRDAVFRFVADEDELDLAGNRDKLVRRELIDNAFCPTGDGGGIDNSCSSSNGQSLEVVSKGMREYVAGHNIETLRESNEPQAVALRKHISESKGTSKTVYRGELILGDLPKVGEVVNLGPLKSFSEDRHVAGTFAKTGMMTARSLKLKNAKEVVYEVKGLKTGAKILSDQLGDIEKEWLTSGQIRITSIEEINGRNVLRADHEVITTNAKRFAFRSNDEKVREFVRFVADEDELDLAGNRDKLVRRELIDNAFCPTGPGGGIDNSCSSSGVSPKVAETGLDKEIYHSTKHHDAILKDGEFKVSDGTFGRGVYFSSVVNPRAAGANSTQDLKTIRAKTSVKNPLVLDMTDRDSNKWDEKEDMKIWKSLGEGQGEAGRQKLLEAGYDAVVVKFGTTQYNLILDPSKIHIQELLTTNAKKFAFRSNDDKVKEFVRFVGETFDAKVNGKTQEGVLARYVATMHAKGVDRAYKDANRYGLRGGTKEKELMNKGGRAEFLRRAKIDPELIDRVKVLASRTYLDVQDVTRKSAGTLRRILVDGMAAGENPRQVARRMMDELDMTKVQATRIARTEMIRAHAEGQLDAFERMGIKGVSGDVEFSATKTLSGDFDSKVCPLCQELDGKVMTIREARGVIPVHPNCRCAWKPAPEEEDEAEKDDKKSKPKLLAPARKGKAKTGKKPSPKRVVVKKRVTKKAPPKKTGKATPPRTDELKSFTVTFGNKVLSKKTFVKPASPSKVRPSARGGAKVVRKKLTTNAFCPTGPGGGIDNSCSPTGGGTIKDKSGNNYKVSYDGDRTFSIAVPGKEELSERGVTAGRVILKMNKKGVMSVTVNPEFQRKGLASALYDHIEKFLRYPLQENWATTPDGEAFWKHRKNRATTNAFCPTGPGGGIDNSCSPGGGGSHTPETLLPSPTELKKVKDLPGSTKPILMRDADGKQFVVKEGKSQSHLENEDRSDAIYRAAGVAVPHSAIVDGKKVSEFLDGAIPLNQFKGDVKLIHEQIGKNFVMDALLANHDVIGLSADNILIKDGKAYRVDNGGAMRFRAQGAVKPSKLWGPEVVQLESMRDKNVNPQSAKVFAHLTDEDIHAQIKEVLGRRDAILNAAGPDKEVLSQRLDFLKTKLEKGTTQATVASPSPVTVKAPSFTPASPGSPSPAAIKTGADLSSILKTSFPGHGYTKLYLQKIEALNPQGLHGGTIVIPMTSIKFTDKSSVVVAKTKQAEVVSMLKTIAPAGTVIKSKATISAKKAGVTKTFGTAETFEGTFTTEKSTFGGTAGDSVVKYGGKFAPVVDGKIPYSPIEYYDKVAHDEWKSSLTGPERGAIASWKGSAKSIRVAVATGDPNHASATTAQKFMGAIERAKPHAGLTYRGISGEYADGIAKQIAEAGVGGTWSDPSPHCMSIDQMVGRKFAMGKLLFRIQSLTGRPIHKEDGHEGEKEVVGMPKALYRIAGIHKNVKVGGDQGQIVKHVIDLIEELGQ